jgi:hypothetical protein
MYGELFGATVGFIIGRYVDDFLALGFAAYFLKNILKDFKITLKETIMPTFTKEEAKECLEFGYKLVGGVILSEIGEFITLLLMVQWLPGYIYILGFLELAKSVASIVGTRYNYQPMISEAYNNGKKKLAEFCITSNFQNWWYLSFFLTVQIAILFPAVLLKLGGEYAAAARIIPLYILPRLLITIPVMGDEVLRGCNRPEYRSFGLFTEKFTKIVCVFLFLSPWGLVNIFGQEYLIELFILHEVPPYIVIGFVEFYLVHKKCVPVKINIWQTFIAGTLASLPLIPINLLMVAGFNYVWEISSSLVFPIILVIIFVACIFLIFPNIMMFFYGFFGGWDKEGLIDFENCAKISGPSKLITTFVYRSARAGYEKSPLKEKFKPDRTDADREIQELIELTKYQI